MKKLLLIFMLIAIAHGVQAQTAKGSVVATGSISYRFENDKSLGANSEGTTRSYNISPQVGYLIADKVEVGVLASIFKYNRQSDHYNSNSEVEQHFDTETTQKEAGLYARRYFFLIDKLAFSGRAEISYSESVTTHQESRQFGTNSAAFYNSRAENNSFVAAIRPGVSFFLSEKISLNATFGELRYKRDIDNHEVRNEDGADYLFLRTDEMKSNNFDLNLSSASFSLGLSYFFHSSAR